ncbi:MAG: hypothetical protein PHU36_08030, partial [Syntrophomonadaceae bacterium]|nr:hypothetical protein [Syntrophomonadaceae bacterium]
MVVLVSVTGLIFLLGYCIFARLSIKVRLYKHEEGLAFTMQAFIYIIPAHRYLEFRYENFDLDILSAVDKAAVVSNRLKKRSEHDDLKAYLIRLGFHDY